MYVIINGVSSDTIQGLQVLSLPPITKPKMRRQVDTIDGRDGDIITELGYEAYDRTITVLLHHNYDLDAITAFFNTSGEIIFSNEPDKKYYFRLLEKIDYERAVQFKTANITFHVQPYKYPVNETPLTVSSVEWEGTDYDQTPYIFRAVSDSSVEVGNREVIEQITGGTIAFNQLCNASSVTIASGRKYYMKKGTAYSIGASTGSAITGLTSGSDMVIDLTQMFGSTIADYIYSLETSTAGAGVSLFKSLFPKDYYPYNSGELMSVKTSAHKTYDANDNVLGNYPISPIELRGIPKLVNNKLTYDGDIYKADGSVTRRYGIATFNGDANVQVWNATYYAFKIILPTKMKFVNHEINLLGNKLKSLDNANIWNGTGYGISSENAGNIAIRIDGITTAEAMKTWLASNPLTVVYELATPTTETTTPYTETQICSPYGTESFVDDRDVQIPVGHKTKYKQINDPADIIVPNAGNVPSAPTIQLTGSGTVGVYLGNAQTLQVNIPEDGITIDTEAQDATSNGQLANRSVTGDYDSVRLQPGDNDVSFSGDFSAVITKYTRWV